MLNVYDLYDLHAIFVNIRFLPNYELNEKILSSVIEVLKNRCNNDFNQFRMAINKINSLNKELYRFAFVENTYTYFPYALKNERVYNLLIEACECLSNAVRESNTQKVYDLADCLHNLPIFIIDNNFSVPKKYWRNEVSYYREKWDNNFLSHGQKL